MMQLQGPSIAQEARDDPELAKALEVEVGPMLVDRVAHELAFIEGKSK